MPTGRVLQTFMTPIAGVYQHRVAVACVVEIVDHLLPSHTCSCKDDGKMLSSYRAPVCLREALAFFALGQSSTSFSSASSSVTTVSEGQPSWRSVTIT